MLSDSKLKVSSAYNYMADFDLARAILSDICLGFEKNSLMAAFDRKKVHESENMGPPLFLFLIGRCPD